MVSIYGAEVIGNEVVCLKCREVMEPKAISGNLAVFICSCGNIAWIEW